MCSLPSPSGSLLALVVASLFAPANSWAQSLDLGGPSEFAIVQHSAQLAPLHVTVEAWVTLDPAATNTYPTVIRKNVNAAEAYTLRLSSFQTGGSYIPEFNVTTTSGTFITRALATPITPGVPTHIAGTYDGTDVRIYVDGQLAQTGFATGDISDSGGTAQIGLGDSNNPLGEQFEGQMDAVRVWDHARSQPEIEQTRGLELNAASGLVASWNLDCNLTDSSGGGHHGTPSAAGIGYAAEAVTFDGALRVSSTGDNVTVPHDASLAPTEVTVEAWFELDGSVTNVYPTIARKNVNSAEAYTLRLSSFQTGGAYIPEFNITTSGSGTVITRALGNSIALGTSTHVAGTYDGSRIRIYVDGVLVQSNSASGGIVDTGGDLVIGQGDSGNPLGEQFEGEMDAVRIWDHARTRCQIAGGLDKEVRSGTGLIGAWNFDQGFGDEGAQDLGGAPSGSAAFAPEFTTYAKSLKLAVGNPGRVEVAHDAALVPTSVTVEAVFELDANTTDTYPTLVRKNVNSAEAYVLRLSNFQTGGSYIPEFNVTTTNGTFITRALGTNVTLGEPHHLAGTVQGTQVQIYLDGALVETGFISGALADAGDALHIGAGDLNNPPGEQFTGEIDSVRIWSFARSESDIAATLSRDIDAAPGLIASWRFDGDLTDAAGSSFNGSSVGTVAFVDEITDLIGAPCMAEAYGAPTSNCPDAPRMFASTPVEPGGAVSFGCVDAPASAPGALFISGARPATAFSVFGLDFWVDLANPLLFSASVGSDANRRSGLTIPFPATPSVLDSSSFSFQYLWLDFTACGVSFATTSDAIEIGPF